MIDDNLTFEGDLHIYRYKGAVVPSVSSIISLARDFAGIPDAILAAAAERGRDSHMACQLDDQGTLDEATITDEVRPYLEAWRLFTREHQPNWEYIEEPMFHRLMNYAGCPDRVGWVEGKWKVVEIKATADVHPAYGVQLAGYANLVEGLRGLRPESMVVQLKPDGTYRLHEYNDPLDRVVFQSMLAIRNWRKKHD